MGQVAILLEIVDASRVGRDSNPHLHLCDGVLPLSTTDRWLSRTSFVPLEELLPKLGCQVGFCRTYGS